MNSRWKQYLLYASLIILGGCLIFILAETVRAKNTGFETKTLWDWMELLIVPVFLAGGAFYFNDRSRRESERMKAEEQQMHDRQLAADLRQEAALQTYLDRMTELILKEKLRATKNKELLSVAKTRTLFVLRGLDEKQKAIVLHFLYEGGLISKRNPIINLTGADLRGANLTRANLSSVELSGADLSYTTLMYADVTNANLLGADLSGADLGDANLQSADLSGANLRGADLNNTKLTGANVSNEQLADAKSLKGATMPDGTIHD